ncbi:myoneurin [Hoplias malabaricus]|uniref:myoneurin n=1 Tax=Hoplias malabaricus TaxID=27720 RepID=UPI0034634E32
MAHKCVVGGCPNRSDTVIHYILPEEPRRRSLWLQFIEHSKNDGEQIDISSRVCGEHFSRENFTKLDLGFTTRLVLNVDAVPTIFPRDRATKSGHETQAAGGDNDVEDTCGITISDAVSLAPVKEEPSEYEVSQVLKPREESQLALDRQVKHEEDECLPSADKSVEGSRELRSIRRAVIKRKGGHLDQHDDEKEKRFSCSTCGCKFRNKGVLMEHESGHLEERKVRTYRCHICGKGFELQSVLKAHVKRHNDGESSLTHGCSLCPRRFRYKGALDTHLRHHMSQVMYKCPLCEEPYQFKLDLTVHVKATHAGSRLVCNFCNKSFIRVDAFFKHIDRHVVATPYYCSTCNIYQLTERGYLCHMRIHEKRSLLRLNAQKGLDKGETAQGQSSECTLQNGSGTQPAPVSLSETEKKPINVQAGVDKGLEPGADLMVCAQSVTEFEDSGTDHNVPGLDTSHLSPEELSYSETSEDTDDDLS